jgi:N-acetylmuramoyl-L-alanine amidase
VKPHFKLRLPLACLLVLACSWPQAPDALNAGRSYSLLVGSRIARFNAPPVVTAGGERYISFAVLDELHPGPGAGGRAAAPPSGPPPLGGKPSPAGPSRNRDSRSEAAPAAPGGGFNVAAMFPSGPLVQAQAQSDATDVGAPEPQYDPTEGAPPMPTEDEPEAAAAAGPDLLAAPTGRAAAPRAGRTRHVLGSHMLDLAGPAQALAAELNGQPVESARLFEAAGQRYLSASLLARLGLVLYYNSLQGCYALAGLVYRVEYMPDLRVLSLSSLTPLRVTGVQDDPQHLRFEVEGGFFASAKPAELSGDAFIQRMSFKSQPQLGRSFIYLLQPRQTGFKAAADQLNGYARIDFGNYFRVASHDLTSSGEISLNVELGAPAKVQAQLLDNPARLVLDFPGVQYTDATQYIPVNQGSTRQIRIGTPQADSVRVVVELSQRLDYRVLTQDNGARYFVQLLPPAGSTRTAAGRGGRTIMLDPGHGGSDEGTEGALPGSQEKVATLQIVKLLKAELESRGYTVLLTRKDDRFVSLGARTDYANAVLPYVFVSIHCNSITDPNMTGAMTFRHNNASRESIRLAGDVQSGLVAATDCVDKGVRTADFFVMRETVMPAILVETGFMTNRAECAKLLDPQYQAKLARGVAQGIDAYVAGR